MPQVPVLDSQSVAPQALQPVYQHDIDVSSGMQKGAAALDQAGTLLLHAADQQNRTAAWQADGQLKQDFGRWQADVQPKMQGASAAGGAIDPTTGAPTPGFADQADQWFEQRKAELMANLNPSQQVLVGRSLAMYRAARVDEARRWQTEQTAHGELTAFNAANAVDADAALKSGDPNQVPVAIASITQRNAQWAATHGIVDKDGTPDANWLRVKNEHDLTQLHAGMVEQLQRSDAGKANAYLAQYGSQISQEVYNRLSHGVAIAADSSAGQQGGQASWTKFLPEGADPAIGATALPVNQMMDDAYEQFKNNPVALKAAQAQIAENYRVWNEAHQSAQRSYKSVLLASKNGGGTIAQMQAMPEWQKLDGDTREQITEHLQNYADRRLARQATQAGLEDRQYAIKDRDKTRTSTAQFNDLITNPDKLAALTKEDVDNLALTMGDHQVQTIAAARGKLNNAADLKTVKLDNDTILQAAQRFNLKTPASPGYNKKGPEAEVYADFRANLETAMTQEQVALKRPLNLADKQRVIEQELTRTVTLDPGFFSSYQTAPLVTLTPAQRSTIVPAPPAERASIVDSYKRILKRAPTEDEINVRYSQLHPPKK